MLLKQGEGKERDEEWLTVRPGMSLENSQKMRSYIAGNYSEDLEEHRAHNLSTVEAGRQSNRGAKGNWSPM